MDRRTFLQLAALPAWAQSAARTARVELAAIETFVVKVNQRGNWVLVRLRTRDGLTGIGEASHHRGDDPAVLRLMAKYFERLKPRGIWDLEGFRRELLAEVSAGGRDPGVAFSALEQCVWDLRGKALGVPVYDLLGGRVHERIRMYANINRSTLERTPSGFARMAESAVKAGFDAVKLAPFDEIPPGLKDSAEIRKHIEHGLDCARAVRDAIGGGRDLLIDAHGRFPLEHGLGLARRIEPLKLFWLEEVCHSTTDLAAIRRAAKMPTAGGEDLFGVAGFYPYIAAGPVDTVMVDVKYCGGVLEMKKIAAMAEGAGLKVSPHGPASPVGNAIGAHVAATLPNLNLLELSHGEVPWRAEVIDPPEQAVEGHMSPSSRPGYGIALNEKTLARYRV